MGTREGRGALEKRPSGLMFTHNTLLIDRADSARPSHNNVSTSTDLTSTLGAVAPPAVAVGTNSPPPPLPTSTPVADFSHPSERESPCDQCVNCIRLIDVFQNGSQGNCYLISSPFTTPSSRAVLFSRRVKLPQSFDVVYRLKNFARHFFPS